MRLGTVSNCYYCLIETLFGLGGDMNSKNYKSILIKKGESKECKRYIRAVLKKVDSKDGEKISSRIKDQYDFLADIKLMRSSNLKTSLTRKKIIEIQSNVFPIAIKYFDGDEWKKLDQNIKQCRCRRLKKESKKGDQLKFIGVKGDVKERFLDALNGSEFKTANDLMKMLLDDYENYNKNPKRKRK